MDEAAVRGDAGRIEALEQQVRQLTSRLAGWVEAQMVQALDDRRNEMTALRAELRVLLHEQSTGMRAESGSILSVATRRLEVAQEQLAERLDTVAERAAELAAARDRSRTEIEALRAELLSTRKSEVDAGPGRVEAFEQRVKAAMGRLTDSVETRLAETLATQDSGLDVLRTELVDRLEMVRLAAAEAGDASAETKRTVRAAGERTDALEQQMKVAVARLEGAIGARLGELATARAAEVEGLRGDIATAVLSLGERIDASALRSATEADRVTELVAGAEAAAARTDGLEQQMKVAVARLEGAIDARLGELATVRAAEVEGLRGDIATVAASLGERIDASALRSATEADRVTELVAGAEAAAARTDGLEQRVKAAVGRLAESVEERLGEHATAQQTRFVQVHERVQAVEQRQQEAKDHLDAALEAKLADVIERRRAEFDSVKDELEETLAGQLKGARTEIATAVAEAHRRFIVSVDQLHERMNVVADQATAAHAAATQIETLQETVTSDGRRLEALEVHTRRTDARLTDVVDAKLSELATTGDAALEAVQAQMRAALDAHLAETRAEVTLELAEGRRQLIDGATRLEERQTMLDRQADETVAGLDAIGASVDVALRAAEGRLADSVQATLTKFEAIAAQVAASRSEIDVNVASVTRRVDRVQDQVHRKVAAVVEQMDALTAKAAKEAGALAPLRSDLRLLQAQVAELAATVAEPRPRRTQAATPPKKVAAAPARKVTAAPAKKAAAPARKAAAPARKAAAPAKKVSRARRVQ